MARLRPCEYDRLNFVRTPAIQATRRASAALPTRFAGCRPAARHLPGSTRAACRPLRGDCVHPGMLARCVPVARSPHPESRGVGRRRRRVRHSPGSGLARRGSRSFRRALSARRALRHLLALVHSRARDDRAAAMTTSSTKTPTSRAVSRTCRPRLPRRSRRRITRDMSARPHEPFVPTPFWNDRSPTDSTGTSNSPRQVHSEERVRWTDRPSHRKRWRRPSAARVG